MEKKSKRAKKEQRGTLGQHVEDSEVIHSGRGKEAWKKVGGRESWGGDGKGGQGGLEVSRGLGGEQGFGWLERPVERWTKWWGRSSLSSPAWIPALPASQCFWIPALPGWGPSAPFCQKGKEMHRHCLMKIRSPKLSNSQDWSKLLTNNLIHKNGDSYQIDLFKWAHAEEIPFGSCTWNFLFPNAN